MEYAFTSEEKDVREAGRRFIDDHATEDGWSEENPGAYDRSVYAQMADLGFFGLAATEGAGGLGMSHLAEGLVLEAAGYRLFRGPLLEHYAALEALSMEPGLAEHAGKNISGERLATIGFGWRGPHSVASAVSDGATFDGAGIAGHLGTVDDAVVVAAGPDHTVMIALFDRNSLAVEDVADADYSWSAGRFDLTGSAPAAFATVSSEQGQSMLALAGALAAAYSLGCAQRLLDDTVGYVGDRTQFGRPIGSFQAIKHSVADLYIEIEHAKSLVYAAIATDDIGAATQLRLMAKSAMDTSLALTTRVALQSHGGIGFTWESHIHRFVRASLRLGRWPMSSSNVTQSILDAALQGTGTHTHSNEGNDS